MRESLLKVLITNLLGVLVHFSSFGQDYIIHEGESWIEIADAEDLNKIRLSSVGFPLDGKYIQTQDIDLAGFLEDGGWKGIGGESSALLFNGVFNGQGFTISNLTINRDEFNQGLFAYVGPKAVLKDIRLTNVSIVGAGYYTGALVARNSGHIINCAAVNGVMYATSYSGGLVGYNESSGRIEQSYSSIDVSGTGQIGGLVGINDGGGLIINSYSQGTVKGQIDIGGLVGRNRNFRSGATYYGHIANSYSSGLVYYEQKGGGLIGNNEGTVEGSYWNIETSQQSHSLGNEEGKSDLEMRMKSTFVGWDFEDVWQIKEGESMPFLKALQEFNVSKEIPDLSVSLNGFSIQNEDDINCVYGDYLNFLIESTSDSPLSDLRIEVSDSSIVDISNFPEVRAINKGTTILKIIQPETEIYDSIEVYFKILVGQKELWITPHLGQQKVYGDKEPQHLKFTIDNLENEDTSLLSGGLKRVEGENVGHYAIQLNDITAGDNYFVSLDTNIVYFKIIPREIFIKIDEREKIYGDLDPVLTFQLLKGDLIDGDTFEGNLQREDGENAGLYYISRGSLTAGSNYLLTFEEDSEFVIKRASSEITADSNQVHVYDGNTKSVIANLNHEETKLNYSPDSSFTEAGEYNVQIHSPETTNYLGANKEVTLTIRKAVQEGIYFEDMDYVYNGDERKLSVSGLESEAQITYKNNGHRDAGIYEVTAMISRPNYEPLILKAKLTIHKAPAEITADPNQVHVYDGTQKSVIASLNHEESELIYEPITATKNAGVYEVELYSNESENFLKGRKKVILTIEKALLTVTVESITREFGKNNPEFTINYKGFENGENEEVLTKIPTVNTIATITSTIGEYAITSSGALADNYDFEYIDGLLTIIPTNFGNIILENKTFIYDGKEHSLKASNLPKDVSIVYENNNHINTGNYLVKATISKSGYFSQTLEAVLTIKRSSQAIVFEEVGKVSRTQSYVELQVKSSAELPIQLFSDDDLVASLDGHTLLIHRLGTVRITASQEGDKNHEPAEPITILVQVEDKKQGPVRVHQALSPNGDGINDFLIVEGIKEFPENKIQIITPSGTLVFDTEGYDNEENVFRGISNRASFGSKLPDGTYFYMLRYKSNGRWESKNGWIYLKTK